MKVLDLSTDRWAKWDKASTHFDDGVAVLVAIGQVCVELYRKGSDQSYTIA